MSDRTERRVVHAFNATDRWHAQRTAASGGAADHELPDLTIAHDGRAFAVEEKTTSDPYVYVDADEVRALQDYAAAYGMRAAILGRFKGDRTWHLYNPETMARTDAGTYRGGPGDSAMQLCPPDAGAATRANAQLPADVTSADVASALAEGVRA